MRKGNGGGRVRTPGRGIHRLRIGASRRGRAFGGLPDRRGRPVLLADARWRQLQQGPRTRKRRLTGRGRATLAALLGLVLAPLVWWGSPFGLADASTSMASMLPPVGAAADSVSVEAGEPAPPAAPAAWPDRAPDRVFEHPPFAKSALDLPHTEQGVEGGQAGRLVEVMSAAPGGEPLRVEYTLDAQLMHDVFGVLERGRVALGNVVVMDPRSGRVLAYASTDPEHFPPTRNYPAASLVKVVTAAAALDVAPRTARLPCRFTGSPYRLTPARIDPPSRGNTVSLRRALATSNNQCLAQLAVHALGVDPLMEALDRFGWLDSPAPAHAAGQADPGSEPYDLGKLGSGLAGTRITPLHAAQLASVLVHGELIAPRWVERVTDVSGERELRVPAPTTPRRVLSPQLTDELRGMLVETTRSGTARRAFRTRSGHPLLGSVQVAGKTGSLSGKDPDGRYEWFMGVAPADDPRIAVASVVVQDALWWRTSSQIAADVLREVFCDRHTCGPELAERFLHPPRVRDAVVRATPSPEVERLN